MAVRSTPPSEPPLFRTLGQDAQNIWKDIHRTGFRRTFARTFEDLQAFYLSEHSRSRLLQMGRVKRVLFLAAWLLKSLFLKLTPARRILLVIAFFFMWEAISFRHGGDGSEVIIRFPFWAILVLLLILMLELKDKLVARNELEAGRSVQQALMPQPNPAIRGWDLWLFTRSANDVGGDLVDYLQLDAQRFGVVLGDVAGKGLPAALLMAKLQATLRALATETDSLADLGAKMNRILCRDGLPNRFATLVYLEVRPASGSVRILNAGHMPPFVVRKAAVEVLGAGAMALGMLPDAAFSEQQVDLGEGDVLVAYSDGLSEAMNARDEFFGEDRLRALLTDQWSGPSERVGERIVAAVNAFVGDARPHDDLSLVILRRAA
jgi:hypothetical protein